jgi:hypothetical protein
MLQGVLFSGLPRVERIERAEIANGLVLLRGKRMIDAAGKLRARRRSCRRVAPWRRSMSPPLRWNGVSECCADGISGEKYPFSL